MDRYLKSQAAMHSLVIFKLGYLSLGLLQRLKSCNSEFLFNAPSGLMTRAGVCICV